MELSVELKNKVLRLAENASFLYDERFIADFISAAEMYHQQRLLQQTRCTTQLPADTWVKDDYCKCEHPTLGNSVSRCGTCDCWFKPIA